MVVGSSKMDHRTLSPIYSTVTYNMHFILLFPALDMNLCFQGARHKVAVVINLYDDLSRSTSQQDHSGKS